MCTPLSAEAGGGGVEPLTKFSNRGGELDRTSNFRGGCGERGGGCNFHIENKLKSEVFDYKKSL